MIAINPLITYNIQRTSLRSCIIEVTNTAVKKYLETSKQ